jgi:Na+-translocating ferredoxin:NAD+ oxidoreductase subunit D
MSTPLVVSLSPHEKSSLTTPRIMWTVVLALTPALVMSAVTFGLRAVLVTAVGMASAVFVEYLIQRFLLRQVPTVDDGSAAVTGMLLAFNLPVTIPLWQVCVGSVVAIGIAKAAFGGLGNNPFNPALVGRAFMLTSFPVEMTNWARPGLDMLSLSADRITGATALGIIKEGTAAGRTVVELLPEAPGYLDLFLGVVPGSLGETSALALLVGGLFLLSRKLITWELPVAYLGSLAVFTGIFWAVNPEAYADPLFHVLAGGAMLAAWFMVTDMTTSPMTRTGRFVFAAGAGVLTGVIRLFGGFPEGASYSILIMNAVVPLIDNHFLPRRFGQEVSNG